MMNSVKLDDLSSLTVQEALNTIISYPRKILKDLQLFDLLLSDDGVTALRHGIYMFFDDSGECIYVGMCSSSHFAHRLGGHFGMSPKYGMNTFLRRAVEDIGLDSKEYTSYVEAIPKIGSYSILVIDANKAGKKSIRRLERILHTIIKPRLNFQNGFPKTYAPIDMRSEFGSEVFR